MISMKITPDKRRSKQDGSFPIVIRITYKGKSRDISTGFTCKLSDWDVRSSSIKPISKAHKIQNDRLKEKRIKCQEKLLEFERKLMDAGADVQTIKEYLTGQHSSRSTVLAFWMDEIKRLEQAKKYGNARNYSSALGGIKLATSLNISFHKIDYSWLVRVDGSLRGRGVSSNSVAVYMRSLRALYNKAINHGIIDAQEYPFRRYKIKGEPTSPRVASIKELQSFFNMQLNSIRKEYDSWNYGRLIFLLRGINFADLAMLTTDNIKHGRLMYKRMKTHKSYSVELLPLALDIFRSYYCKERFTLLPILTNEEFNNKSNIPKRVSQLRKTTNKWLRRLGLDLGMTESLTTYVFRYSHANACKKLGYSKDLIGESLGHNYGMSVTSLYLEDYNIELVDKMNSKVCQRIIKEL